VLWIDDEASAIKPLVAFLKVSGCRVELAANGAAGLARARSGSYDVIVLDFKLPDFSGMQVLEQLRRGGIGTPVIMLTAYATFDLAVEATKLGVSDFKAKPILGSVLFAAIRDVVNRPVAEVQPKPLFQSSGQRVTLDSVRGVLRYLDQLEASRQVTRSQGSGNAQERDHLASLLARVLADPEVTFLGFTAGARALRLIGLDVSTPLRSIVGRIRQWVEQAAHRDLAPADPRAVHVLRRLEAAGARGLDVTEGELSAELDMHEASVWRLLQDSLAVNFRQCRRAVMMRRAIQALADSDEQVAQIAYQLGYADASHFDHDFKRFLGTTPQHYRRVLRMQLARP
jgi:YesN/AraC family two-component response regulator